MNRPAQILLLEDSPSDRYMTQLALEESGLPHVLHTVEYGVDLLRFVRREAPYADAPRPDLILLDLNVPQLDGREVLRLIKGDPALATIPVAVLTTSVHPHDLRSAYAHHANCYLRKPTDFAAFVALVSDVVRFWCHTVVPAPPPDAVRPASSPAFNGTRRLLLIEDSPSDAALVRDALASVTAPYTVLHATRLTDALALLREQVFDVVVTDLSLPDTEGLETIRLLAAAGQAAPIIALTGSYAEVGEAALTAGADDFLPKSDLSAVRLERVLRHAIRRRHIQFEELQTQRVQTVGRLAASVAHDMNNLLAAIRLTTEVMEHEPGTPPALVQEILANVQRGTTLTRQLLTFGRRSDGQRSACEVNGAVTSACALIGRMLRRDVSLVVRLTEQPTPILADVHQIEQAIMNLALNANDAMPSGGTLEISTRHVSIVESAGALYDPPLSAGDYVEVSVCDSGTGIAHDILPRIFEPFFTTKREHEGTGLGLASVREIARLHLGSVQAANRPSGGACFSLLLPRQPLGQLASTGASLPAREPAVLRRVDREPPRVLLAEDDPAVSRAIQRVLQSHGYTVIAADSADAAWRAFEAAEAPYDALVTDIMMPGTLTVRDLVERVRAVYPSFPVVYCSGYPSHENEQALLLDETLNFVPKPFNSQALLRVLERQRELGAAALTGAASATAPSDP